MSTPAKPHDITVPFAAARSATASRILAADDQQHILDALEILLKPQGYRIDAVRSPELAREALATEQYDAVLIDLNYTRDTTSGREGHRDDGMGQC
jgi:DNA-binding NtrC family response regulator